MNPPPLKPTELDMVRSVFRLHPEIETATLFGSRAKGTHSERSDVDLVVTGDVGPLRAEGIAAELDELPLPNPTKSPPPASSSTTRWRR
jgi:predicted nucleotidyltransferase